VIVVSTVRPTHLPPLGEHLRVEIGSELQTTLVELIDLALIGKQLHWSVVGPGFLPLHLMLDEMVESWRALADTVAERAVAIGSWPDGQAHLLAAAEHRRLLPGPVDDEAVVRELARRLGENRELARARMDRLGELDLASQDVVIEVVRALEEQLWMIRSQLPHGR
jgi:starvation-inducible DNA-binding protein